MLGLLAISCSKDEVPNEPSNNADSSSFQFGDGTLVAVRSETLQSTPIGDMTINIGTAVAAFSAGSNYSILAEAGTVKVNGEALQKSDNNAYVFTPGLTLPTGIEYGNSVEWSVAGNSSNGIPSFNHTFSGGFPTVGSISSGANVSKSGFTLAIESVTNADSVYFMVNEVYKSLPGNTTSYTFTSAELSSLTTGQGIVSVAAWRYGTSQYGGKSYYFINETVKQKTVTITN